MLRNNSLCHLFLKAIFVMEAAEHRALSHAIARRQLMAITSDGSCRLNRLWEAGPQGSMRPAPIVVKREC